jgi:hypothetical protein
MLGTGFVQRITRACLRPNIYHQVLHFVYFIGYVPYVTLWLNNKLERIQSAILDGELCCL